MIFLCNKGELVLERSPACPGDSAVYRCSFTSGRMEWMWTTQSETEQLSLISSLSQTGIMDRSLQQTKLLFNVTDLSPTYINVLATVSDPISLNGTQMDCNGQTLTIEIRFISKCLYQLVCRTPY